MYATRIVKVAMRKSDGCMSSRCLIIRDTKKARLFWRKHSSRSQEQYRFDPNAVIISLMSNEFDLIHVPLYKVICSNFGRMITNRKIYPLDLCYGHFATEADSLLAASSYLLIVL